MFSNLINKKKIQCPRCLGKGEVSEEDIKRLGRELKWLPGDCAYCRGKGEVAEKIVNNVNPNLTYFSLDISDAEKDRIINKDNNALNRAKYHEEQTDQAIAQIQFLHFKGKMNAELIADFYFIHEENDDLFQNEKDKMLEHIRMIISKKS